MRYPILPRRVQTDEVGDYVTREDLYADMESRMKNMIDMLYELELVNMSDDFDRTKLAGARIDMRVCMNFVEELRLRDK